MMRLCREVFVSIDEIMQETFLLKQGKISCEIKRHSRSKRVRISVSRDGRVLVTLPKRGSMRAAKRFVAKKEAWITEQLEKNQVFPKISVEKRRKEYLAYRQSAREYLNKRVDELNHHYGFSYGRVAIRDQRTRWGSCSKKGNLNFHYRLIFLPRELSDYVIVHELAHLSELNHSPRFWKLVEEQIPDYASRRKALKHHGR